MMYVTAIKVPVYVCEILRRSFKISTKETLLTIISDNGVSNALGGGGVWEMGLKQHERRSETAEMEVLGVNYRIRVYIIWP
jgi:hypothetical protein